MGDQLRRLFEYIFGLEGSDSRYLLNKMMTLYFDIE